MPQSLATIPLEDFLTQANIESSPAWEFIDGRAMQKPMPTLFHSRLQRNLVNYINDRTDRFEAVQQLRCIIPPYSPVPDIVVIASERLGDEDGPFNGAPDWLIEIRSPDQSTTTGVWGRHRCRVWGVWGLWVNDVVAMTRRRGQNGTDAH